MRRYVTLGDGRKIGLGAYVSAWKTCLTLPPDTHIGRGVDGWGQTAADALRDLRAGMHDRINQHLPSHGRGRKWHHDWQRAMMQAAHRLNHPRLVIDGLPPELRDRFAHRLRS
mgnify:CR=1 FL=1